MSDRDAGTPGGEDWREQAIEVLRQETCPIWPDAIVDDDINWLADALAAASAAGARAATEENDRLRERVRRLEASIDVDEAANVLEDMGNECIELAKERDEARALLGRAVPYIEAERDAHPATAHDSVRLLAAIRARQAEGAKHGD